MNFQESIMTPRSRKPVMLAIFGNSDPKSSQNNISLLLEEHEDENEENTNEVKVLQPTTDDISSANDNGLPIVDTKVSNGSSSSSSLSSAFREYLNSRGNVIYDQPQDDESFSSQPDDFESSSENVTENVTEYQKLESSSSSSEEKAAEIDEILNQSSNMSESLLYCLDGNSVSPLATATTTTVTRKRHLDDSHETESSNESIKRPLIEIEQEPEHEDITDL